MAIGAPSVARPRGTVDRGPVLERKTQWACRTNERPVALRPRGVDRPRAGGARGERHARRRLHAARRRSSASRAGGCDALKHTAIAHAASASRCRSSASRASWRWAWRRSLPGERARVVQLGLAAIAGLVGLSLLVAAAAARAPLPVLLRGGRERHRAALVASARLRLAPGAGAARACTYAVGAAMVASPLAVPLVGGFHASTDAPVIQDEMARTPRGRGHRRRLRRLRVPLLPHDERRARAAPRGAPRARAPGAPAGAAARCTRTRWTRRAPRAAARSWARATRWPHALFTAPEEELTPEGCEKIAEQLGPAARRLPRVREEPGDRRAHRRPTRPSSRRPAATRCRPSGSARRRSWARSPRRSSKRP